MRKKIIFIFGFVFLAGSMVPFVSASRYVYHMYQTKGYLSHSSNKIKASTNRVSPYRYRQPSRHRLNSHSLDFSHASNRHDPTYYRNNPYASRYSSKADFESRISYKLNRSHLYPRVENTLDSTVATVHSYDYLNRKVRQSSNRVRVQNLDRWEYSLEAPQGFTRSIEGLYNSDNTSLQFQVVKSVANKSCTQLSFLECSINLNKGFRSREQLALASRIQRTFRWNQIEELSFDRYPTVTEAFVSRLYGKDYVYFIFNALNPETEEVYQIEAVALLSDAREASADMFKVFQSFRFTNN